MIQQHHVSETNGYKFDIVFNGLGIDELGDSRFVWDSINVGRDREKVIDG